MLVCNSGSPTCPMMAIRLSHEALVAQFRCPKGTVVSLLSLLCLRTSALSVKHTKKLRLFLPRICELKSTRIARIEESMSDERKVHEMSPFFLAGFTASIDDRGYCQAFSSLSVCHDSE